MNKYKLVSEFNEWVQKEFGSLYFIELNDDDLSLVVVGENVAWFDEFKPDKFDFEAPSSYGLGIKLIEKDIIKKFYEKGVELLNKYESKYTIQVLPSEYGFLYKLKNDLSYLTTSDVGHDCTFTPQWGYFTQSEIEELKKRDDVSIDWNKAIIKEVKENEND